MSDFPRGAVIVYSEMRTYLLVEVLRNDSTDEREAYALLVLGAVSDRGRELVGVHLSVSKAISDGVGLWFVRSLDDFRTQHDDLGARIDDLLSRPLLRVRASEFARRRHADAGKTYGDRPYWVHLHEVVLILEGLGFREPYLSAGYLHDVVEDTPTTREEVRTEFGPDVEALVWAVTGQGRNRRERTADTSAKILALRTERPDLDATSLKLADRIANVRECARTGDSRLTMYRGEQDKLAAVLAGAGHPALWEELRLALR